jgi:hypothetical protein
VKRIFTILLFILYAGASLGLQISYHFCENKLQNVGLSLSHSAPDHQKAGCCRDLVQYLKVDTHNFNTSSTIKGIKAINKLPVDNISVTPLAFFTPFQFSRNVELPIEKFIPKGHCPRFILNNVIRI